MLIGIDAVDIDRFKNWNKYCISSLMKIFTQVEIDYCLSNQSKTAERFAARFAAKEAAFKASYVIFSPKLTFLQFCKYVEVVNSITGPMLKFNNYNIKSSLSITHSKLSAIAVVIIDFRS